MVSTSTRYLSKKSGEFGQGRRRWFRQVPGTCRKNAKTRSKSLTLLLNRLNIKRKGVILLMARKNRIWIEGLYYHVVSRGVRQEPIFREQKDYSTFLYILTQLYQEKIPFELPSYCLMNNHFHLLIRTKTLSISRFMYCLNKRYATYFNNKYNFSGGVFEKRFFASPIYTTESFLNVSRYIHLNPLKAKLVKRPEHYPWNSYSFYKETSTLPPIFIPINQVLNKFPGSTIDQRKAYCLYVEKK